MTRRTHGIRTAVTTSFALLLLGVFLAAGCSQQQQQQATTSAAQVASAVVTTATGQSNTTSRRVVPSGVKPNGRGGIDASEAMKAARARLHYMRDHRNDIMKPWRPSTQPATQPTTATAAR